MPVRDILLFAAVGISLPICFIRPVYGVLLWTVLGFLNPQSFTYGFAHEAPFAQAVAIPTLAGFMLSGKFKNLVCTEMCLLGVLWAWFTLTTFNSANTPELAAKAEEAWFRWGFVSKILLMTVLAVGVINSRARLRWLLLAIAGSFAGLVIHSLPGMILSGGQYRVYGPENSLVADNNALGLALVMVLPFFFFLAKTESKTYLKRFLGLMFLTCIPAIFFTYSRGTFVGLIAVGGFMFLRSNQKLVLIPVVLLALLFGAFLAPQKWRDRIGETTDTKEASAAGRLNAWAFCWNLAKIYPVMGGGFEASTRELFAKYAPNPRDYHGPHSIYFGVLVEHGFVGFFLYFLLVAYCFVTLHRLAKLAGFHGDEQSANYANMLQFSLIGFLANGAFVGRTYFDFYFMIVACVAILRQVCREEWAASADSEEDLAASNVSPIPVLNHAGA
jgi:probable O-glycosylation ligase (exosortase A-associated)